MIPHDRYFRQDHLDREMERLFQLGFEFVCLTSEVSNNRDFACIDYAGCSVVVQNFDGELRAFQNVCTHRFNQIQTEVRGNRSLTCRYHGWTFNESGAPIGMRARIAETAGDVDAALCLTRFPVETCGQFVFVNRARTGVSLRDYLGAFFAILEELSLHMGAVSHFGEVPHQANWKVLVENVIDNTHCALLHRDSFVEFGFCRKPIEDPIIDGPHSSWHVPRTPIAREKLRRRALTHLEGRGLVHDSFHHIHISPNLFIASTEGLSFYIGHALPIAPEQTVLRVRYLEPAIQLTGRQRSAQDALNLQTHASGLKIVEEDRPILERVQRGLKLTDKPGAVMINEPRIASFFAHYTATMDA